MQRVLVVDDERDIVELIRYNLTQEGYEVITAFDGAEALRKARAIPDLVILDLMMPVLDGFETCRRLKADPSTGHVPVIFLTARSSEIDEVEGLELGADDYIQKPISPRKLVARVRALLRRKAPEGTERGVADAAIKLGRLIIDPSSYTVHQGSRELFLARKEFELLLLLASHPGKVFTREMLLDRVWGSVVVVDRTVDVHVSRIREKLGHDADLLETVKGVGYRLRERA